MSENTIQVRLDGGVATVELARPERRNAFNSAMAEELGRALGEVAASDATVVVVRGRGPAFCAGWDLEEIASLRDSGAEEMRRLFLRNVEILRTFDQLPQPTIVGAHGAVAGFGLGLLARADLSLVAAGTHLALPEIAHRIVPALVMLDLAGLPQPRNALEWLLSGEPFSPEDAAAAGLVTRVTAADELDEAVDRLARSIAAHDRETVLATKRTFRQVRSMPGAEAETTAIQAAVSALAVTP
jgi:methylglutaconyl-CoA hydratase